jgi:hypothetical protein
MVSVCVCVCVHTRVCTCLSVCMHAYVCSCVSSVSSMNLRNIQNNILFIGYPVLWLSSYVMALYQLQVLCNIKLNMINQEGFSGYMVCYGMVPPFTLKNWGKLWKHKSVQPISYQYLNQIPHFSQFQQPLSNQTWSQVPLKWKYNALEIWLFALCTVELAYNIMKGTG